MQSIADRFGSSSAKRFPCAGKWPLVIPISASFVQRLSGEAHQRIRDAYDEADLILLRTISSIHTQYEAQYGLLPSELKMLRDIKTESDATKLDGLFSGRKSVSFDDYCARGNPALQLAETRLQAARIVMQAIAGEFARVGTGIECWSAIPIELDLVAHTYKLADSERQIIWAELKIKPGFAGITKPAANKPPEKRGPAARDWEIDGHKLRNLRAEHEYSQAKFCRQAGLSVDSLGRIESGTAVSRSTAYKVIKRCLTLKWISTASDLKKQPQ